MDINYKSALFLLNHIRFPMKDWPGEGSGAKMGGRSGTVEADETYVGGKPRYKGTSKRGKSISRHHLPGYLGEFEFRGNTRLADDGERTSLAVKRALGKRLVFRAAGT